mmetsp:Transcript_4212/g.9386  ORF Transcript_4212/g.9386 Transcript_4212/m.9386 type:complete len:472 (+) Transcript_4212:125-1540(+)
MLRPSGLQELESSLAPKKTPAPDDVFAAADEAVRTAFKGDSPIPLQSTRSPLLDRNYAKLMWFATPSDAAATLRAEQSTPALAEDGAVFSGEGAPRPEQPVFTVKRWGKGGDDESTVEPGTPPAPAEEPGTGDADWEATMGEWGCDAEDAEDLAAPATFNYLSSALHPEIPKTLRKSVGEAVADFGMIKDGDRLLVGLSGGKDSLTMLHILLDLQRRAKVKFEVAAATVNPETPEYNPGPLIDYMKALGVRYHFLCKPLIEMAKKHLDPKKPSICSFCARMKRGMLYSCMRKEGYNVLCLGQHLDDFAESLLMSAFHNGSLRTMKANYSVEAHDLRVARPLVYVRERVMAQFSTENKLPIIQDNCPACFAAPKERHRIKLVLAQQEFEHPNLFWSLQKAMKPLMSINHADRSRGWFEAGPEEEEETPLQTSGGACDNGMCGLGSDGAMGVGSDDVMVSMAPAVDAATDLAA